MPIIDVDIPEGVIPASAQSLCLLTGLTGAELCFQ
jgi:hypothetical protein